MSDPRFWGYPVRLIVDLKDGPHDISHLIRSPEPQELFSTAVWTIPAKQAYEEIIIEIRARERAELLSVRNEEK